MCIYCKNTQEVVQIVNKYLHCVSGIPISSPRTFPDSTPFFCPSSLPVYILSYHNKVKIITIYC